VILSLHTPSYRAVIVAALLFLSTNASAALVDCDDRLAQINGYQVIGVEMRDPLGFIAPGVSPFSPLKRTIEIKEGQPFQLSALSRDVVFLRTTIEARGAGTTQVFKIASVWPHVLCDQEARTLRVSYWMLTNVVSAYVTPSIEQAIDESERPATTGAARNTTAAMSFVPLGGYNATRGLFGGLSAANAIQGLRVSGQASGSGSSLTGRIQVAGAFLRDSARWRRGELKGAFEYLDAPAGTVHAHEGKLAFRFSRSTKELTKQRVVFRYGGSLEGGRQRSDDGTIPAAAENTGYGSLKLYAGTTGRRGQAAFTSSYGFQLGTTFADAVPSFAKHLIDVGYSTRLFGASIGDGTGDFKALLTPGVHRSMDLQVRFSAGAIQHLLGAPIAERFLGGNELRPLVLDDEWVIRNDAFIRSIPENTLATAQGFAGGDRFYAANVTAAWPLWGRPLLPGELAKDDSFLPHLNGGFRTIVDSLADSYKANDPKFAEESAAIPSHARTIDAALDAMTGVLQRIPAATAKSQPTAKAIKDVQSNIRLSKGGLRLVEQGDATVAPDVVNHRLPALGAHVEVLRRSLDAAEQGEVASDLAASLAQTDAPRVAIQRILMDIDSTKYRQRAAATLAPAHNVLDVFLHQLNLYSIAPVAIFDAAQIFPTADGVRYGVGAGMRFSLVNVNFSAAYVFNLRPVTPEGRGAVFIKLDVTNMFP